MFYDFPRDFKVKEIEPGWLVHTVCGQHIMFSYLTAKPYSVFPNHKHHHEQMGFVMEGEFEMNIGGELRLLKKGDTYMVPPNIIHGAATHASNAVILDVFSPPREDYLFGMAK